MTEPRERVGQRTFAFRGTLDSHPGRVGLPDRVLAVYCSSTLDDPQELLDDLRRTLLADLPPGKLFIIAPGLPMLEKLVSSGDFQSLVADNVYAGAAEGALEVLSIKRAGHVTRLESDERFPDEDWLRLIDLGLVDVFKRRGGFLVAGPDFHYVSPSGRHTRKFMRVGNLLMRGVETEFIAAGLLRLAPPDVGHIYTDTASINPVAQALSGLQAHLGGVRPRATVDSFSCWSDSETFAWSDPARSLCLISASTSGTLALRVRAEARVDEGRIVTLFHGGNALPIGRVLCHLPKAHGADDTLAEPETWPNEASCSLCSDEVPAVHISGDQFLPARPVVRGVLVRAQHAPSWFSHTLPALIGRGVISCYRGHRDEGRPVQPLALDLSGLIREAGDFRTRQDQVLRTLVPASLGHVIHADDPASRILAEHVVELYERDTAHSGERAIEIIASSKLREARRGAFGEGVKGSVLVVASAATTGRNLRVISQALRGVGDDVALAYFAAAARLTDIGRWQKLRTNLAFGDRLDQHPVHAAFIMELPDETDAVDSWPAEKSLWERFLAEPGIADTEYSEIHARLATILAASATGGLGLGKDAFLASPSGEPLEVQSGWAFFRSVPADVKPSQADVFFTVAAVLHALRLRMNDDDGLMQFEHSRRLISPENFARFNDPAVQAALLRAARRRELNYGIDPRMSSQMADVLAELVDRPMDLAAQALPEFLLAIATGRLTLESSDLGSLLARLDIAEGLTPLCSALHRAAGDRVAEHVNAPGRSLP